MNRKPMLLYIQTTPKLPVGCKVEECGGVAVGSNTNPKLLFFFILGV